MRISILAAVPRAVASAKFIQTYVLGIDAISLRAIFRGMIDKHARPTDKRFHDADPTARGRGRPVGDHEAKRAELLKAAISVIAQEGLAGASLRKVAQRAGCTHPVSPFRLWLWKGERGMREKRKEKERKSAGI